MNARFLPSRLVRWVMVGSMLALTLTCVSVQAQAPASAKEMAAKAAAAARKARPEYPPFADVIKGYTKIVSTMDGKPSLYTIYVDKKKNQMLAQLPSGYASQRHFIAMTVASGETFAGLQAGEMYVYWRKFGKRLALIRDDVGVRSTGDAESKSSVKRIFTDRVILDVPIVTMAGSAPVIDMDMLLVGQAAKFFGRPVNPRLFSIATTKAFPQNVELSFETASFNGQLKQLHYSISRIPSSTGYQPRTADTRVGYFTTGFRDLGKYDDDEVQTRYINRWHLEKSDRSLKMSPVKNPIIFYIEHTTPKRYRYWVKKGILAWNKAFEKIGLYDAIQVRQQDADAKNPKYMDLHPEDVRYNFVRWLNNGIGTAIGPSRVNPMTGQILDADIILTDGWIRHYEWQFSDLLPKIAMDGVGPRTTAWLNTHPRWDPRVRLAPPARRNEILAQRARDLTKPYGGHPIANADARMIGDDLFDGLAGRTSQCNGMCMAADGVAFELAMLRSTLELLRADEEDEEEKEDDDEEDEDDGDEDDEDDDEDGDEDDEDENDAEHDDDDEKKDKDDKKKVDADKKDSDDDEKAEKKADGDKSARRKKTRPARPRRLRRSRLRSRRTGVRCWTAFRSLSSVHC